MIDALRRGDRSCDGGIRTQARREAGWRGVGGVVALHPRLIRSAEEIDALQRDDGSRDGGIHMPARREAEARRGVGCVDALHPRLLGSVEEIDALWGGDGSCDGVYDPVSSSDMQMQAATRSG